MDLIKVAEEAFATGKEFPKFKAGDTITVAYNIVEGSKERIQLYRGVVIKISGHGNKKRFTVRKMSGTVGVGSTTSATLLVRKPASKRNWFARAKRLNDAFRMGKQKDGLCGPSFFDLRVKPAVLA